MFILWSPFSSRPWGIHKWKMNEWNLAYWCPWVFLAAWEGLLVLSSNILSRRHISFMGFHCWKYLKTLNKNTEPKYQQPLKQTTTPSAKLTPSFCFLIFHRAGNRRDTYRNEGLYVLHTATLPLHVICMPVLVLKFNCIQSKYSIFTKFVLTIHIVPKRTWDIEWLYCRYLRWQQSA